jgi:Tfp pilus assembly protein PilX
MKTMKKQEYFKEQKEFTRERGTVLVVVLLVTTCLLVLSMPFLTKLSGQYRVSEGSYKSLAALNLAEAGVERAIWELNFGDIDDWSGDSMNRLLNLSSVQSPEGAVLGDIVISVSDLGGDNPVIESTGQIDYVDDLSVERTTRIVLQKLGGDPLFDVGVFALESVTLAANLNIDGDVGTNGTLPGALTIGNNTTVSGDAFCGPGGDPEEAIELEGTAEVLGQLRAADEAREFPSVVVPEGLIDRGEFYIKGEQTIIGADGQYLSFIVDTGSVVEFDGDVTLHVTGPLSLGANTELRIAEGGRLTLYLSGSMLLDSNCSVNNTLQDPTSLIILGTDDFIGGVTFDSNTPFYGAVYMPSTSSNPGRKKDPSDFDLSLNP